MKKLHDVRDAIISDLLGMEDKKLKNKLLAMLNLENLEKKMQRSGFPEKLIEEIIDDFKVVKNERGDKKFSEWMYKLNYKIPEPYQDEVKAENIYTKHKTWIERENVKLEDETELSWQEQSADLTHVSTEARKAQLVLRQRISDLVLNILDSAG